jgi:hypothetical protein
MKTPIKRENDEFLFITLKHVSCLYGPGKFPWNPRTVGNSS